MVNMFSRFGPLVALLSFFLLTSAQNTTTPAASTFYLSKTETEFSLNVANGSSDVSIFFTSPAYSWVGVGFGDKMENSLMFIMYPNDSGDNVTISPRLGSKHAEPSFTSAINLEILDGTTITNDSMLVLRAVCHNCLSWQGGHLDTKTTAQPMIYAFGSGSGLSSNSRSAGLNRHVRYGHFTMDMLAATGLGGVPAKSSAQNGVKIVGEMVHDHDRANLAHAITGCLALFVIWPLNVLFAGFLKNVRIHIGVSVVVMAFLITAYALGISTSHQFNRSKAFTSPHQIFAFIAIFPILLISLLPIPNISRLHTFIPGLHTPLVSTSFVLLVLTGGLGLHLSSQARSIILVYTTVALLVFVFLTTLQACIRRRGSAYARANKRARLGEEDDHVMMMGKMDESRSSSKASLRQGSGYASESREFGADGQAQRGGYGGGAMPGPQYLLNMHPGVPVHKW
ncbi:CBD9-like protein [Setomelanomma holmii]|uniref:CBD9-like protein n=1 Tax=Setomelanomma holmii TaxID=210430 RepID=A0A9P4HD77_9PLEO|nr:CBD9-like protein [Setomelanomma holmii]